MRVVIVGTNHAGIAAANTLLDNYPEAEVVMIDRNSNLSYLGCGTALWVGRQIDSYQNLFYTSREAFEAKGAKIFMETSVTGIDFTAKTVSCEPLVGAPFTVAYDKLILATGSLPIAPKIPGNDLAGISFLKLFQEGQEVDRQVSDPKVDTVAVIGAGYIGVEIAEAAHRRGKRVRLFDIAPTSLASYYDPSFAHLMDERLERNGIECHFGEGVEEYIGDEDGHVRAVRTSRDTYPADLVVNAIGFVPNTELGRDALELGAKGAYRVDRHQQTSIEDVYAIGDCATIYSNALRAETYIALATNAVRSGIVAGHNAGGTPLEAAGVQGSNAISVYGLNLVSTGLSVAAAERAGLEVLHTDFEDLQRPAFMRENGEVKIRIVYERGSRRIVGAQLASELDVSPTIHLFSLAIEVGYTIDQLKLLDIFFLPHFNQPYNYITMAALGAE
ncbi:H2O-forming NADH oxidase [Enorma burkinafasonensis]|uniref:H2O-forming NADH oxidase n=1 Tax=Enorma burkinafasonensis TaxID=2590867 RepID=UPI00119CB20A|nr:FAD-dependent oxidoreductase [Enorma burkinafasonensis]